jgi:hypothetical protein
MVPTVTFLGPATANWLKIALEMRKDEAIVIRILKWIPPILKLILAVEA